MSNNEHPITPSPELVQQLADRPGTWLEKIINAYQVGANQELEACCKAFEDIWDQEDLVTIDDCLRGLRAARRPKPKSLKEQALEILNLGHEGWGLAHDDWQTLRRALVALPE